MGMEMGFIYFGGVGIEMRKERGKDRMGLLT